MYDQRSAYRSHMRRPGTWFSPLIVHPDIAYPLFVSRLDGCLTHRTRHAQIQFRHIGDGKLGVPASLSYQGMCGIQVARPRGVNVREESFLCALCFKACERYGVDHFNLVPSTGCEVSQGRRGKTTKRNRASFIQSQEGKQ